MIGILLPIQKDFVKPSREDQLEKEMLLNALTCH